MNVHDGVKWIALVGALSCSVGFINDGKVRGVVKDDGNRPVSAAQVDVVCGKVRRRLQSTVAGTFAAQGLPPGLCTVVASKAGVLSDPATVQATSSPALIELRLDGRRFTASVVVTPSRGQAESGARVPESVTVTSREALDRRPYTLLGQALREQPGVMVQQTSTAQVSPVIRGFTGQSNVYLFDGVRLNVSTWRSGPSQYFAWLDANAIDSLEVVRGSGSLQYGSDALGGTIQLFPARPQLTSEPGVVARGQIDFTAASSDRMTGAHFAGALESRWVSVNAGFDGLAVGDLRAGGGDDSHAAVTRFLGMPARHPGGRMPRTGYDMRGGYANVVVRAGANGILTGTYLGQQQSGVNRYDRIEGGEGLHLSGFTPQRLDLALVRYEISGVGILDRLSTALSVNRQTDGRFEQARPSSRLDSQDAVTTAVGYHAQGSRFWGGRHQTLFGAEYYDETVSAKRVLREPNGATVASRPDVPDGTTYGTTGLFVQQVSEVLRERVWVKAGLRYSRFAFGSTPAPVFGVVDERVVADAVTYQVGAVAAITRYVSLTANASRGFRAGNAADLANIGLTGGGGFEISPSRAIALGASIGSNEAATATNTGNRVVPLTPEVADTYEAAIKVGSGRVQGSVSLYTTELRDTIQRRTLIVDRPVVGENIAGFVIVRQDSAGRVFIAEDTRPIATRVNLDRARIRGLDAEASWRISQSTTAAGRFSLSNGRVVGADYLRRMPPPMGGFSLRQRFGGDRGWVEGAATFARAQTRLNAADLTDARIGARRTAASIATFFNGSAVDLGLVNGGRLVETGETLAQVQARVLQGHAFSNLFSETPGFVSIGVRAGWSLSQGFGIVVIGENLGDRNYRWHGSGVDAPGRNVQVRIRYSFKSSRP